MKIFRFIVLIHKILLCYASLPININQFWFQIIEDQGIIYQDTDQNQWVFSKLNQNGDIILSIKLNNFVGKNNSNDEYMIEPDNQNHRYLYIFSYQTGQYQKIDYDLLLQTQNNQKFDCQNDIQSYGSGSTRYIKIDSNYVKYGQGKMSQVSKTFSPGDQLVQSVDSFYKYPNFFQYVQKPTNYIYWKGIKYVLNGNYKSLVIDYENNIVLTTDSILAQFSLDSDTINFKYQIQLKNDLSKIAFTEIYSINNVRLFGIYDDSLQFYDLNTFKQVSYSSNSDQIGQITYFNQMFSYKNLIIAKTDVYKMTYDQMNNLVTLKKIQTLKQQLTLIYQTNNNAIWRSSYTQGQTQILQVGSQNQMISMERIICQDGYFLNSNSDCTQCLQNEILQNDKCVSCPQGQKKLNINDKVCFTVTQNCDQPTVLKTCDCQNYNYQNSSQKCIQCQAGEQFNISKDSCVKSCGDKQYFDGQNCQQCIGSCQKCSDGQTCDQCDSINGYYLNNKKQCFKCDQTLQQILNKEKNGCDCQKSFFLDSSNICKKCQEGCDDCDISKCNSCIQGYYKEGQKCSKCIPNCIQCSGGQKCDQCDSANGYFSDSNQICVKCDQPNQVKNNQKNGCDCQKGFFLDSNNICQKCQEGCDDCDISKCNSCIQGYYIENQKCSKCIANCIQCSNNQKCDQCDSAKGYFTNSKQVQFQILFQIHFNIYDYSNISQICVKCDQPNQVKNNQKNSCDCQKGYFLDSNNVCQKCQEGCEDCDIIKCNSCTQGYYKESQKCTKCIPNCIQCTGGQKCDQCDSANGYFSDSNQICIKCDQLTQVKNNQTNSCDCKKGYFLDKTNLCKKCQEGCDNCSINYCNLCIQGYYLDTSKNQCQKCMDNCEQCTQKDQCNQWKACENGQYRDKQTYLCQPCHPKCKSCNGPKENNCRECFNSQFVNEEGKCSDCEIGQYKEKNQCLTCHWSCKECNGPNDNNCLSCQTSLQISSENKCLTQQQKENDDEQKKVCQYSWFVQEDQESNCQQTLQYAKLNNQFIDKLSIINLILAFIVTIFVPLFSPFAWFYIQQQQLIGNFALLKSMNIMWINQLQLKVSFGHNIINNFSNFLQKSEDKYFDFSLFDEFAFQTQPLYKYFIENTLVHVSMLIVIIIIFGLLMILKSHSAFAERLLSYIQWNLFIRFFMVSSNFIILSAIVEIKNGNFSNIPSLIFFIFIGVFYLIFQIKSLRFLFSYHYYLRFFDKNTLICLKNGLIDTQRWPRLFWLLFELRKIISCISLYLLQDTIYGPWIVLGLSIFQIVYFVIYKPLIDKKANIFILTVELLFAFVTTFISLLNNLSIQSGSSSESSYILKAKVITGGLIAIQVFCLIALIYICSYGLISIILQNRSDRLKNSFENSQLIIQQNFKFESFDQIVTALAGSNQNISWQQKTKKK
ncbi:hypothetical protein ABPG74_020716 [Tetrahymena malaccensis]